MPNDRKIVSEEAIRTNRQESDWHSPTLLSVIELSFDEEDSACASCPSATWYTTNTTLRCYCKWMFMEIWKEGEEVIRACDGRELSIALEQQGED